MRCGSRRNGFLRQPAGLNFGSRGSRCSGTTARTTIVSIANRPFFRSDPLGNIANSIVPAGSMSLRYGEMLLKDVTPAAFARFPSPGGKVIQTNHPAFVFGHLAIYPHRLMTMLGRPVGVTAPPEGWEALFKAGVECRDDPQGTIYPPMAKVVEFHKGAYEAAIALIAAATDEELTQPNPGEGRMKEMFPTIGALANFLLGSHVMSHYGQVSAWRRCMGLGSAM